MDKNSKKETAQHESYVPADEQTHSVYAPKPPVPLDLLRKFDDELAAILHETERDLGEWDFHMLTDAQRRRLLGSGVRRFGFITKTFEVASDNPEFTPPFLNMEHFHELIDEINQTRNITITANQLLRIYTDILLLAGDEAFTLALIYYNSVRDAARRGIPGAQAVFRALELFFRRGRRLDEEPTIPEVEKDVDALLHGRKDGTIVIEGHGKHTSAAEHTVVDDTYKPKGAFKETVQGAICEACGTQNGVGYKFCKNCGAKLEVAA